MKTATDSILLEHHKRSATVERPGIADVSQQVVADAEAKLAHHSDEYEANTTFEQSRSYVRRRYLRTLLSHRRDEAYQDHLEEELGCPRSEIDDVVRELEDRRSTLSVRAGDTRLKAGEVVFPKWRDLGNALEKQMTLDPSSRLAAAKDLVIASRLPENGNTTLSNMQRANLYEHCRELSTLVSSDDYAFQRMQLLQMPVVDRERYAHLSALSALAYEVLPEPVGERLSEHVTSSPGRQVPDEIAKVIREYFAEDADGEKPSALAIAHLAEVFSRLGQGDLAGANMVLDTIADEFAGYDGFDAVVAATAGEEAPKARPARGRRRSESSKSQTPPAERAREVLGEFLEQRLSARSNDVPFYVDEHLEENIDNAIEVFTELRNALATRDRYGIASAATRVNGALGEEYPVSFDRVVRTAQRFRNHQADARAVGRELQAWLKDACLLRPGTVRERFDPDIAMDTPNRVFEQIDAALKHLYGALEEENQEPKLKRALSALERAKTAAAGTDVVFGLECLVDSIDPEYDGALETIAAITSKLGENLRPVDDTFVPPLAEVETDDGYEYSRPEILEVLGNFYREARAVYAGVEDTARLEGAFPGWASENIRSQMGHLLSAMRARDSVTALFHIGEMRADLRETIAPDAEPRSVRIAEEISTLLGPKMGQSFGRVAKAVKAGDEAAFGLLDSFVGRHAKPSGFTKSELRISGIEGKTTKAARNALSSFLGALIKDEHPNAMAAFQKITEHFCGYAGFDKLAKALTEVAGETTLQKRISNVVEFLQDNGAVVTVKQGSADAIEQLRPDDDGRVPTADEVSVLRKILEQCQAGERPDSSALSDLEGFENYGNYRSTLRIAYDQLRRGRGEDPRLMVPFIEEFLATNVAITDADLRNSLDLDGNGNAPEGAADLLIELKSLLAADDHLEGASRMEHVELDGLLEQASRFHFGCLAHPELDAVSRANAGSYLVGMRAGLQSLLASGFDGIGQKPVRMVDVFAKAEPEGPDLRAHLAALDEVLSSGKLDKKGIERIADVADAIVRRLDALPDDLQRAFAPRLRKIQDHGSHSIDPSGFVEGLLADTPVEDILGIATDVRTWARSELGRTEPQTLLETIGHTLHAGEAIVDELVVAENQDDALAQGAGERSALALEQPSARMPKRGAAVFVKHSAADAAVGPEMSRVGLWAYRAGVPVVGVDDFSQLQAVVEKAGSQGVYVRARDGHLRIASVPDAVAAGWVTEGRAKGLRSGPSLQVTHAVVDDDGRQRFAPAATVDNGDDTPWRNLTIPMAMASVNGLGAEQCSVSELVSASRAGRLMDHVAGPRVANLVRFASRNEWIGRSGRGDIEVPHFRVAPFEQVAGLLRESGASEEIARILPEVTSDDFAKSKFATDPAERAKKCDAIRTAIAGKLRAALLATSEDDQLEPTPLAKSAILDPLTSDGELMDGRNLRPLTVEGLDNVDGVLDYTRRADGFVRHAMSSQTELVEAFIDAVVAHWSDDAVQDRLDVQLHPRAAFAGVLFRTTPDADASGVVTTDGDPTVSGSMYCRAVPGLLEGIDGGTQVEETILTSGLEGVYTEYRGDTKVVPDFDNGGTTTTEHEAEGGTVLDDEVIRSVAFLGSDADKLHGKVLGFETDSEVRFYVENDEVFVTNVTPLPRA